MLIIATAVAAQPRYTACNGTQRTRYYVWSTPKVPSLPLAGALHYTGLRVRARVSGCASVSARAEVRACAPMRMRVRAFAFVYACESVPAKAQSLHVEAMAADVHRRRVAAALKRGRLRSVQRRGAAQGRRLHRMR